MEYHDRLKKVMKDAKVKNKDLIVACDVSNSAISQWRSGETKPKNLLCIADACNWDPEKLEHYLVHGHSIPVQNAIESIKNAGLIVVFTPKDIVACNLAKWSSANFIVTTNDKTTSVFVDIHPKKRLGIPMSPSDTKDFVYISEDQVENAGQILKEHFEKYGNQIKEDQGEYLVDTLQNTGTLRNSYKTVPIVGMAQLGDNGFFEEQQYPVGHGDGYIDTPTTDPNAYALKVVGDSMHPAIRHGWYVVIEPNLEPYNGMIALFKFKDGRKMVKELANSADGFYTLLSINEDHKRITAAHEEIEDIHPVAFIAPPNKVKHP